MSNKVKRARRDMERAFSAYISAVESLSNPDQADLHLDAAIDSLILAVAEEVRERVIQHINMLVPSGPIVRGTLDALAIDVRSLPLDDLVGT